jgi:hypothetical protein
MTFSWHLGPRTYTRRVPVGDYVLGRTGVSWSVNRSLGDGVVDRWDEGETDQATAREAVLNRARSDATDAWETAGAGEYRLIRGYRSSGSR